jgi:hypothetical protein
MTRTVPAQPGHGGQVADRSWSPLAGDFPDHGAQLSRPSWLRCADPPCERPPTSSLSCTSRLPGHLVASGIDQFPLAGAPDAPSVRAAIHVSGWATSFGENRRRPQRGCSLLIEEQTDCRRRDQARAPVPSTNAVTSSASGRARLVRRPRFVGLVTDGTPAFGYLVEIEDHSERLEQRGQRRVKLNSGGSLNVLIRRVRVQPLSDCE